RVARGSISWSPGWARVRAGPIAAIVAPSIRMSAADRKSSVALTVRTAPPCRTVAMSVRSLAGRSPAGRGGKKATGGTQSLADVIDHQARRRRGPSVARHEGADSALRPAGLGQRHIARFGA